MTIDPTPTPPRGSSGAGSSDRHLISPSAAEIAGRLDRLWSNQGKSSSFLLPSFEGMEFGNFRIEKELGAGAFGVVYKALDLQTGRHVALKIPRPENLKNQDFLLRFESEAKAAARLDHPSIVATYSADLACSTPYIASALCEGPDLARWLDDHRAFKLDPTIVARFVIELIRAVEYAHGKGVIHRDIKPSNVLMVPLETETKYVRTLDQYLPKLADFGLAKLTTDPINDSRSSLVIGTPTYMAPEQLLPNWGPVTEKTDIYALGVLMFELMEGVAPRHGWSYAQIVASLYQGQQTSYSWTKNHVPEELQLIIEKCLEPDPVDRYASAQQLANDVACVLRGERISIRRPGIVRSLLSWMRNPSRPREIVFFLVPLNIVMLVWMLFCAGLLISPWHDGVDKTSDFCKGLIIAVAYNLPMVVFSAMRLYGYRWATWVALMLAFSVTVVVPFLVILGWLDTFTGLYLNRPYFRVANHFQILLFGIVESILLGVSLYSDYANKRRLSERVDPAN